MTASDVDDTMEAFAKEGLLLKKSSKKLLGVAKWKKRYAVLEGRNLLLYVDKSRKELKKEIDMKKVTQVFFHYDENAPKKSKKIDEKGIEESRFDIYTTNKRFKFKTKDDNIWESQAWVKSFKKFAEYYNPNYGGDDDDDDSDE